MDRDLADIFSFSIERWGIERAARYRSTIGGVLERLLDTPRLGEPYRQGRVPIRSIKAEQHRVYYTFDDAQVLVIRILHTAMDASAHLP